MATVTVKQGILNLPGATLASKKAVEELLAKDHDVHHCYFRSAGLHNHLSHHLLAAYDLGGSAELLKAIYEEEAKIQRPILLNKEEGVLEPGSITKSNWTKSLGEQKAYAAYVQFFKEEGKALGPVDLVEKYIFSKEANDNDAEMLLRLMSGAVHPFIQLGYAAEFGNDLNLISEALAQAAIHKYRDTSLESVKSVLSEKKISLFQVVAEILKSPILAPVMPYKPEALFSERINDAFAPPSKRGAELARLTSMWDLPDKPTAADLERAVEEAIWVTTLLFAGTSKAGYKPRLDFFLMHGLTSSLFIRSLCLNLIKNPESQARLIRYWVSAIWVVFIVRGRPQVNGETLMSHSANPIPPNFDNVIPPPSKDAIVPPTSSREAINPWPLMIQSSLRAPDSHTTKSLRTLLFGAIHYGTRGAGEAPGAIDSNGNEALPGLKQVDGTIFVRAAGVLIDTLGWVDWGQPEGSWDRSALGWDEAWKHDISTPRIAYGSNAPIRVL